MLNALLTVLFQLWYVHHMTSNSIGLLSIQLGQTVQEKGIQCTHLLPATGSEFQDLKLGIWSSAVSAPHRTKILRGKTRNGWMVMGARLRVREGNVSELTLRLYSFRTLYRSKCEKRTTFSTPCQENTMVNIWVYRLPLLGFLSYPCAMGDDTCMVGSQSLNKLIILLKVKS